mmetsp:Transcript_116610/g.206283  ORF Transcript_116610/g.206283 Transcript_116610/m.206283 type:complete len:393 (-) Transcript_116610:52-1230(-)
MLWQSSSRRNVSPAAEETPEGLQAPPRQAEALMASEASSSLKRSGTCRICFEGGGELIAPCLCKGSSKWVHRDCLNHWRVSGTNPRALTNCCECGFQYHMRLERVYSGDGDARRRVFLRRLAGQTLLAFLGLQGFIVAAGFLVRALDPQERLVKFWLSPQDLGYKDFQAGSYREAWEHHKLIYYVAGLVAFLAVVGIVASVAACATTCFGVGSHWIARPVTPDIICCDACCRCCCEATCDCGYCCAECCSGICRPEHLCACDNCFSLVVIPDFGEALGVLLAVAVLSAILVGIFTCIVLLVSAAQEAVKKYARLQEMRIMSQEYFVEDLSDPSDLGDTQVKPGELTLEERLAERQVTLDLVNVFGEARPGERGFLRQFSSDRTQASTSYGSA